MPADLRRFVLEYLEEAKLMTVATAKDSEPWAASVWYVHDNELNLYFISRRSRRHSLELKENPHVAGTITKPHVIGSGEKVRGIQFEGVAHEATGKTLKKALSLYLAKYPTAEKIPLENLQDKNFMAAFYVIHPKVLVLFDEINFPDEPRQELRIR